VQIAIGVLLYRGFRQPFDHQEILGGEVTTISGPQHRAATKEPPRRYPLPLQLGYKATSKLGPLYGFGQIRVISSKDIIFGRGGASSRA
jgi:hypothetical protein